ncbi:MAG: hypothetical protein ACK6BG_15570, partial [Cyanobacteriota bacterium]
GDAFHDSQLLISRRRQPIGNILSLTSPSWRFSDLVRLFPVPPPEGLLSGRHLNHEPGIIAGRGSSNTGFEFGFVMIRL